MARAKQPKPVHQLTVAQFEKMFPDEEACKAYLVVRRWPEGVFCPRCGNPAVYDLPSRKWHWQCEQCAPDGYRFSHIAGTIFENTNKPLRDWYRVIHLMLRSKKGMSASQIMCCMGFGSYKTAWEMCHKVRVALMEDIGKLGGIVEVDETFVGGLAKNRHWDKRGGSGGTGGIGSGKACSAPLNGLAISVLAKTSLMPLWTMPGASTSSEQSIVKPSKASGRSSNAVLSAHSTK
jgi:hypothetical protein